MDWTDLIDTAFEASGNRSKANQVEAVRAVEVTAIDGEKPVASTAGRHPEHFRKGVLVLTTHRLLFLKDGKPPVPVPLAAVTDVSVTRTKLNGEVLLVVALTGSHRYEDVVKAEFFAEQLRASARAARNAPKAVPVAAPAEAATGEQLIGQLERLAALRASGALTEDEFTRAKQRLIG
ncbi:SHOCT domain-containing protein [Kitasatospora sp. NPDC057542]|uniref:SHOCT domain-containing protein n=1 Tax=Streptomycetaceae TaxID=2062 RepID=UPI001CC90F0A|nr:SHOCT domain-containing protein [Streptomyces sp. LS1784]